MDLRLTIEWGIGMRRQDPSYGEVVHTSFTSSGPSRRRGVAYIEWTRTPASPRYKEFRVHKEMALLVMVALNALMALKVAEWTLARCYS